MREPNFDEILPLAGAITLDGNLRRMIDFITAFRTDEEKKLASLFHVLEIAQKTMGNRREAAARELAGVYCERE